MVGAPTDLLDEAVAASGLDDFGDDSFREGFEMLVDNFSAGIIGGAMAIFGLGIMCGMGYVPAKSSRFLYFYTVAKDPQKSDRTIL